METLRVVLSMDVFGTDSSTLLLNFILFLFGIRYKGINLFYFYRHFKCTPFNSYSHRHTSINEFQFLSHHLLVRICLFVCMFLTVDETETQHLLHSALIVFLCRFSAIPRKIQFHYRQHSGWLQTRCTSDTRVGYSKAHHRPTRRPVPHRSTAQPRSVA